MLAWKDWVQDHILVGVGIVVIAGTGLAAAHWTGIVAVYPMLVGGVLTLCGINKGSEIAYDSLTAKSTTVTQNVVTPDVTQQTVVEKKE